MNSSPLALVFCAAFVACASSGSHDWQMEWKKAGEVEAAKPHAPDSLISGTEAMPRFGAEESASITENDIGDGYWFPKVAIPLGRHLDRVEALAKETVPGYRCDNVDDWCFCPPWGPRGEGYQCKRRSNLTDAPGGIGITTITIDPTGTIVSTEFYNWGHLVRRCRLVAYYH